MQEPPWSTKSEVSQYFMSWQVLPLSNHHIQQHAASQSKAYICHQVDRHGDAVFHAGIPFTAYIRNKWQQVIYIRKHARLQRNFKIILPNWIKTVHAANWIKTVLSVFFKERSEMLCVGGRHAPNWRPFPERNEVTDFNEISHYHKYKSVWYRF